MHLVMPRVLAAGVLPVVAVAAASRITPGHPPSSEFARTTSAGAPSSQELASAGRAAASSAPNQIPRTLTSIRYGPEPYQLLDLHFPDPEVHAGPWPVIVFLHAGGWVAGSRANVSDVAMAQVSRGYAVASVDYQLATTTPSGQRVGSFPGAVWDVDRAIAFLSAGAVAWGLDPSHVILMGSSAGGHLAALAGASRGRLEPDSLRLGLPVTSSVAAVIDLSGITDVASFESTDHPWAAPLTADFLGCPLATLHHPTCPEDALRRASVASYVDSSSPPIFMAYGGLDTLVVAATQGRPLADLWVRAHAGKASSAVYDLIPNAGHNLSVGDINMRSLDEFLDRAIGGAPLAARRVVLYGDSLAWEARDAFRGALLAAGVGQVTTETFGGTAMCDWLDQMRRDATDMHPEAVVVEFSGNALTPCMRGLDGTALSGEAYFEKYTADAQAVLKIFSGGSTLVFFATAPISRRAAQVHDTTTGRLDAILAGMAASNPAARLIDAGAAVTDNGAWTATLPCLPEEPCSGTTAASGRPANLVRAPDGAHFCPVAGAAARGVVGTCPVWSSGAYRYGTAMADPIPVELTALAESGVSESGLRPSEAP